MTTGSQTAQAFYHGTSAGLFGRFSLDHALEGDGKVKFGWGVYVIENLLGRLLMELREGNGTLVLSRPLPLHMTVFGAGASGGGKFMVAEDAPIW